MRHENITIGWLAETVHNPAGNALVKGNQRTLGRAYVALQACHVGNLPGPRTGSIYQDFALNLIFFLGNIVPDSNALYYRILNVHPDNLGISLVAAAITGSRLQILPGHAEAVNSSVRHLISYNQLAGKVRFNAQSLLLADFTCWNAAFLAALQPRLNKIRIIALNLHKHAGGSLNTGFAYSAQDGVLLDTLPGSLLVLYRIPGTAVQQAVIAGAGTIYHVQLLN